MIKECQGMCLPMDMQPTMAEQLQTINDRGGGGGIIARLTFADDNLASTAPCSFEVYDYKEGSYIFIDNVGLYTIEEIFAGGDSNNLTVGDKVPILWGTDTGRRQFLPPRFQEDGDGFLGMLNPIYSCFMDDQYVRMDANASAVMPYSMNECSMRMNRPWSQISEEERQMLRAAKGPPPTTTGIGGESMSTTEDRSSGRPTMSPIALEPLALIPKSPTDAPVAFSPETFDENIALLRGYCFTFVLGPLVISTVAVFAIDSS